MSDRQIVYLTDAKLITCVLQNGLAEKVLDAAKNCGAQGATVSYARGTGVRDRMGLIGVTIDENKEVVRIIVSAEQACSADTIILTTSLFSSIVTPINPILSRTPVPRA